MMKSNVKYRVISSKIIAIILGILFSVSGFVKGVDPIGFSYKLTQYFEQFSLNMFSSWSMFFAVVFCALEIFIGLMLLAGIWKRTISIAVFLFLFIFTIITFYLYINPYAAIHECGCFGDAIHLTNDETFYKNCFFLLLSILYVRWQFVKSDLNSLSTINKRKINTIFIPIYITILALFVPIYSYLYLPPFDFLPFNKGVNVLENINKVDHNETQDYLSKFGAYDADFEEDMSQVVFSDNKYTFVVIAQQIANLTNDEFTKISSLQQLYKKGVIKLYVLTSSDLNDAKNMLNNNGWETVPVYNVDQTVLKSMIRNDIGVMMLNQGVIGGKWNLKNDSFSCLNEKTISEFVISEQNSIKRYILTLILMIIGLFMITFLSTRSKYKNKPKKKSDYYNIQNLNNNRQ